MPNDNQWVGVTQVRVLVKLFRGLATARYHNVEASLKMAALTRSQVDLLCTQPDYLGT